VRYSDNPLDLSNCSSLDDFDRRLIQSVNRLFNAVKPGGIIAILIGDKRKNGKYYPLLKTILNNQSIGTLKAIIIKVQHHCRSDRKVYPSHNPFLIPIKHEYCLIYQK
jgi:hypothetical protein